MLIAPKTAGMGILARWYAEPLNREQAEALIRQCESRQQALLKRHGRSHLSPLLKLIALHWLGEPVAGHYHHLRSKQEKSIHVEILKPLIYGQLLMSRRQEGATLYLDEAFERARLLLRPDDYFAVVNRQKLLKELPVGGAADNGETLDTLLTTAGVIEQMKQSQGGRPGYSRDPNDLYG